MGKSLKQQIIMTAKQLRRLADEWINTLRLSEYNIKFWIKNMDTLEEETDNTVYGYCQSSAVHLEASISLLDPKSEVWLVDGLTFNDYTLDQRIEEVLVHEICHIFFEFGRTGNDMVTEEAAVVRLSKALMKLKYTDPPALKKKVGKGLGLRQPICIEDTLYPVSTNLKKDL